MNKIRSTSKLKNVYDPEVPVNIIDLGLIYSVETKKRKLISYIFVNMSLTSEGCLMGQDISDNIRNRLSFIDYACINIVWKPLWGPFMMSGTCKNQLDIS